MGAGWPLLEITVQKKINKGECFFISYIFKELLVEIMGREQNNNKWLEPPLHNNIVLTAKSCIFLYLSEQDASDGPEQLWHEHKDRDRD